MSEKHKSVGSLLNRAASVARKGDITQARALYNSILERFPKNERAKKALAALSASTSASPIIPTAATGATTGATGAPTFTLNPSASVAPSSFIPTPQNSGGDLPKFEKDKLVGMLEAENLEDAIAYAKELYKSYPQAPILPRVISMTYELQKKKGDAAQWAEELYRHEDGTLEDYMRMASNYGDDENYPKALAALEKAYELEPENIDVLRGFASCLCVMYEFQRGIEKYNELLKLEPENMLALRELVKACRESEVYKRAVEAIEKAHELEPDNIAIVIELGITYSTARLHKKAVATYERVIDMMKATTEPVADDDGYEIKIEGIYVSLAQALRESDQFERGFEVVALALELDDNMPEAYQCRGALNAAVRNKEAALKDFEKAISIRGDIANMWHVYSMHKKFKAGDEAITRMEDLLATCDVDERKDLDNRILWGFALGKAYADFGDVDNAFHHFSQAAYLRKEKLEYDFEEEKKRFEVLKTVFSPLHVGDYLTPPDTDYKKKMIFILGMPRSGTSLTEQILDSHSLVHGAGELNFMNEHTGELLYMFGLQPEVRMQKVAFDSIAKSYMESIDELACDAPYVTDKLPHNFARLGFILGGFPEAKIIHMNRDPIAVCWSNFQKFFPARGMAFSFDFETLGKYYKLYLDIMDFWKEKYPGRIYDLHYESLTSNQEVETRKLLAHCGLEWEQQCLDFHLNRRHVHTASQDQVRQKMYQGSSEAWRAYEKHLAPLIEELKGVHPLYR